MFDNIKNKAMKLLLLCMPLVMVLALVGCNPSNNTGSSNFEKATVVRVIDGDTIHLMMDGKKYKLRMIGVDTPETVHPNKPVQFYGKEASDYSKRQLKNKTVYLQKDVSDTDKYGRLLRYVWLERPSSDNPSKEEISKYMYNAQLVINGYAYAYSFQPDTRYSDLFASFQHQAQEKSVGLWNEASLRTFNESHKDNPETRPLNDGKRLKAKNPSAKDNITIKKSQKSVKGNKNSKVYHLKGSKGYDSVSDKNAVYFDNKEDAINAGYRKSKK